MLVFSDPQLEREFRHHQHRVWGGATELWRLKMNLLAGVINFSITIYFLSLTGSIFTRQAVYVVAPYMTVATLHYCLAQRQHVSRRCTSIINHAAEVCYSLICTLSMPTWVLHGDCVEPKVFWKKLILGSGILIGTWLGFLTPAAFTLACLLTPLQFAFQAWHLTQPTCADLTSSPQSISMLQAVLRALGRVASWSLHGSADASTTLAVLDPMHGCRNLMYLLQLFAGGTMLYVQYRLERSNRLAFLHNRAKVVHSWPRVPTLVQAVLHAVVYLQLFAVAWVVLQGASSSSGSGGGAPAAPTGASVFSSRAAQRLSL